MTNMHRTLDIVFTTDNPEGRDGVVVGPVEDAKVRNKFFTMRPPRVYRVGHPDEGVLSWIRYKFEISNEVAVIFILRESTRNFSKKKIRSILKAFGEADYLVLSIFDESGTDDFGVSGDKYFDPANLLCFLILDHHQHGGIGRSLMTLSSVFSLASLRMLDVGVSGLPRGKSFLVVSGGGTSSCHEERGAVIYGFFDRLLCGGISFHRMC